MEHVTIQDCGCIALPEAIASALDLRRGMMLEAALANEGRSIVLTPCHIDTAADTLASKRCPVLPPSS